MEILITTHFVKDFDLGANGNLYGGRMLEWLDEAGALFVHEMFNDYFVTWKLGETIFHRPVKAKSIIKFYVKNVDLRNSSVGFDLVVRTRDSKVLTTSMVFVCIDPVTGEKKNIAHIPQTGTAAEILHCILASRNGEPVPCPAPDNNDNRKILLLREQES